MSGWVLNAYCWCSHVHLLPNLCKYLLQTGECDVNSFSPGISAPVNSIVFVPWDSSLILVALERWLYLLDSDNFQLLWQAQTATPSTKVKLAPTLHHYSFITFLWSILPPGLFSTILMRTLCLWPSQTWDWHHLVICIASLIHLL